MGREVVAQGILIGTTVFLVVFFPCPRLQAADTLESVILGIKEVVEERERYFPLYRGEEDWRKAQEVKILEHRTIKEKSGASYEVVIARYLSLSGADGGDRCILLLLDGARFVVFKETSQFFRDLVVYTDGTPGGETLISCRSGYCHGFCEWDVSMFRIADRKRLFSQDFFSVSDKEVAEESRYQDLDGDGIGEILMKVTEREPLDEHMDEWKSRTEYRVFRYSTRKDAYLPENKGPLLKEAKKIFLEVGKDKDIDHKVGNP